ncbi:hypothetical protein C8J57DRAFT_629929 [Mycena rebaudengoi]|nr:hypothetical protein C8J57DRAFT_629929 [Mycena rebaudengoi]
MALPPAYSACRSSSPLTRHDHDGNVRPCTGHDLDFFHPHIPSFYLSDIHVSGVRRAAAADAAPRAAATAPHARDPAHPMPRPVPVPIPRPSTRCLRVGRRIRTVRRRTRASGAQSRPRTPLCPLRIPVFWWECAAFLGRFGCEWATSVLAQATYNTSSSYPTTSTSCIPIFYHLSDDDALTPTSLIPITLPISMGAAHRRTARRRTRARERRHPLVLLRVHRAHTVFWWVFLGRFLGCERGYAVFAVGEVWLGWGAGAGAAAAGEGVRQGWIQCIFDDGLRDAVARTGVRWGCGEQDGVACAAVVCDTGGACEQLDNAVRPGHLLADAAIRNDATIHDAGRDAALADGEV